MLDDTVFLTTLFVGPGDAPLVMHLCAALIPALIIGWAAIKGGNRFLATVGFASLNALVFYALVKLTEGGYSYWLYSLCRPLHEVDWTGMIVPSIKDQALVYGLPALIHGLCAPLLGATLMTVSRAASRRRG